MTFTSINPKSISLTNHTESFLNNNKNVLISSVAHFQLPNINVLHVCDNGSKQTEMTKKRKVIFKVVLQAVKSIKLAITIRLQFKP